MTTEPEIPPNKIVAPDVSSSGGINPDKTKRTATEPHGHDELPAAQSEIERSRQKYQDLFDFAPVGYLILDENQIIREINLTGAEMLGKHKESLVGKPLHLHVTRDSHGALSAHFRNVLEGRRSIAEADFSGHEGATFPAMLESMPVRNDAGKVVLCNTIVTNIAERKRAEEALLREKRLSEDYINSLPGLFYVFDEERFVRWNSQWEKVTGRGDKELAAMYGPDFFKNEGRRLIVKQMRKVFREGAAEAEAELVTMDGRRIPYFFTGVRKKFDGKNHLIGLGVDITDRKRTEEALKESEEKFSNIFRLSPIAFSLTRIEDGKFIDINRSFARLFGYTKDEIEGKTSLDLNIWAIEDERKRVVGKLVEEGKLENEETQYRIKSGEIIDAQVSSAIIKINNQPVILSEIMDITEKKKAEQALKKAKEIAEAANRAKSEFWPT